MQHSEQINELAAALAKAQAAMPSVPKTKTAKIKMKSGGEYGYSYADLADVWAACRGPLSDNGLSIVQTPGVEGHDLTLETMLLHSSGQWMTSLIRWPGNQSTMQELGSAITHLRRYAMAMIGIVTDADDDAQNAPTRRDERQPERTAHQPTQQPAAQNGNGMAASEPQVKKIYAMKKQVGWTDADFKAWVDDSNIDMKNLSKKDASWLIEEMQKSLGGAQQTAA